MYVVYNVFVTSKSAEVDSRGERGVEFLSEKVAPKLEASNGENGLAIRVAIVDGERITIKTIKYF